MQNKLLLFLLMCSYVLTSSCGTAKLNVQGNVAYRSFRIAAEKSSDVPRDAKILACYFVTKDGELEVLVENRTSKTMTIDQEMSFVVRSNGVTTSFYDPVITGVTTTEFRARTGSASLNLESVGNLLGIGGKVGATMSGIGIGSSMTSGQAVSETSLEINKRKVVLGPSSYGLLKKRIKISGLDKKTLTSSGSTASIMNAQNSLVKFKICINYSFDGGKTYDVLESDVYMNSKIVVPITEYGKINNAVRQIYSQKPDAVSEPLYMMKFNDGADDAYGADYFIQGALFDYK